MVYNSPIRALCQIFPFLSPTKTYTTATVPRYLYTDYCPQYFNMKTSILIFIIVTCMGLRSLANVIPPSIREFSCGAMFCRYNMGMYPFFLISQCPRNYPQPARAILGRVSSDESKWTSLFYTLSIAESYI
jgi:hypothetical protein